MFEDFLCSPIQNWDKSPKNKNTLKIRKLTTSGNFEEITHLGCVDIPQALFRNQSPFQNRL
jgi:hypothetical protein